MQELFVDKIHFSKFLSMSDKPPLHQLKIFASTRSKVQASLTATGCGISKIYLCLEDNRSSFSCVSLNYETKDARP